MLSAIFRSLDSFKSCDFAFLNMFLPAVASSITCACAICISSLRFEKICAVALPLFVR